MFFRLDDSCTCTAVSLHHPAVRRVRSRSIHLTSQETDIKIPRFLKLHLRSWFKKMEKQQKPFSFSIGTFQKIPTNTLFGGFGVFFRRPRRAMVRKNLGARRPCVLHIWLRFQERNIPVPANMSHRNSSAHFAVTLQMLEQ